MLDSCPSFQSKVWHEESRREQLRREGGFQREDFSRGVGWGGFVARGGNFRFGSK